MVLVETRAGSRIPRRFRKGYISMDSILCEDPCMLTNNLFHKIKCVVYKKNRGSGRSHFWNSWSREAQSTLSSSLHETQVLSAAAEEKLYRRLRREVVPITKKNHGTMKATLPWLT